MSRVSWDDYFLSLAQVVSTRSTCLRRQVGAVLVRDNRIVSTGYNGAPTRLRHCAETGCERDRLHIPSGQRHELCRGMHADANALLEAGHERAKGATLYLFGGTPCSFCAKMIVNAGVVRVICQGTYPDTLALDILMEAGVTVREIDAGSHS